MSTSLVRDAFAVQARACTSLGSPFMGQLMALIADRLNPGTPVADRVLNWTGDPSPHGDSVPLRLAGALHALRIDGLALEEVYPPAQVDDDALWSAVSQAMETHSDRVLAWLDHAPQTNEVRRASAILPALAVIQQRYDMPVELLELGTSGGLNLRADRFRLDIPGASLGPSDARVVLAPDWHGPTPPSVLPKIRSRAGVDLSPIDATSVSRSDAGNSSSNDRPNALPRGSR